MYFVSDSCFWYRKHFLLLYKTSFLNEEVNNTEPSFSVSAYYTTEVIKATMCLKMQAPEP
jgi:hypothetical protein